MNTSLERCRSGICSALNEGKEKDRLVPAGLSLLFTIAVFARIVEYPRATLERLTLFVADRPFQYRVLVPAIVHVGREMLPMPLKVWYGICTWASVYLILILFERLLSQLRCSDYERQWYPLLLLPLVINYIVLCPLYYPSDLLSIALFEWGLLFILQRKWSLLIVVFVVGAFNRDTIVLLAPSLLLIHWPEIRNGRWSVRLRFLSIAALLSLVFIGIRAFLQWLFRHNGGAHYEVQLQENLLFVRFLLQFKRREWCWLLGNMSGLHVLTLLRWRYLPAMLRRLLSITPLTYAIMFFVGRYAEVRVFGELIPVMTIAVIFIGKDHLARAGAGNLLQRSLEDSSRPFRVIDWLEKVVIRNG